MTRQHKKFLKLLARKTQKEIWTLEFNIAIIDKLVMGFAVERLKLLEGKLADFIAKDLKEDKKKTYDTTHKLEEEIEREKNVIKGTKNRKKMHLEGIHERRGKLEFIKNLIKGRI